MQEDQTDASLVMCALADNTEAFTVLIERYQVMLIYIALRYVDDEEYAPIDFGLMLSASGQVWLQDASLEIVELLS